MEFGIFNEEGCIESGHFSREAVEARMAEAYTAEAEVHIAEVCPEHEEQEREGCEMCNAETEEEEDGE